MSPCWRQLACRWPSSRGGARMVSRPAAFAAIVASTLSGADIRCRTARTTRRQHRQICWPMVHRNAKPEREPRNTWVWQWRGSTPLSTAGHAGSVHSRLPAVAVLTRSVPCSVRPNPAASTSRSPSRLRGTFQRLGLFDSAQPTESAAEEENDMPAHSKTPTSPALAREPRRRLRAARFQDCSRPRLAYSERTPSVPGCQDLLAPTFKMAGSCRGVRFPAESG